MSVVPPKVTHLVLVLGVRDDSIGDLLEHVVGKAVNEAHDLGGNFGAVALGEDTAQLINGSLALALAGLELVGGLRLVDLVEATVDAADGLAGLLLNLVLA